MADAQTWQSDTIGVVTTTMASLSIFCAIASIVLYAFHPRFRIGTADLVVFMAITELISLPAYAVGIYGSEMGQESLLCQWQSMSEQVGDLAGIFCTGCMALDLLLVVYFNYTVDKVHWLHSRVYIPICLSFATFIAIIPAYMVDAASGIRFYGDSDLWCWITAPFKDYQLYLFYIPLWVVFIFNFVVYVVVGRLVWKRANAMKAITGQANNEAKKRYFWNASLFLIAFLICWTPATINRLSGFVNPGSSIFTLRLLHGICVPGSGVVNFAVYYYVSFYGQPSSTANTTQGDSNVQSTDRLLTAKPATASEPPAYTDIIDMHADYIVASKPIKSSYPVLPPNMPYFIPPRRTSSATADEVEPEDAAKPHIGGSKLRYESDYAAPAAISRPPPLAAIAHFRTHTASPLRRGYTYTKE